MTDMTVANTILEQLGGNKFIAMTGARNLTGSDNSLSFRLPGAGGFCKQGINAVKITLTAMDDYIVEALRIRGSKIAPVAYREGVYCDTLRETFETMTGLRTSLTA